MTVLTVLPMGPISMFGGNLQTTTPLERYDSPTGAML